MRDKIPALNLYWNYEIPNNRYPVRNLKNNLNIITFDITRLLFLFHVV